MSSGRPFHVSLAFGISAALFTVGGSPSAALAGKLDPALANLCEPRTPPAGQLNSQVQECSWIRRQTGTGLITDIVPDDAAQSRFRSMMSELGVAMAPRLVMPADTLGFSGFQISGELGLTGINNSAAYWHGVDGVQPQNATATRPGATLTTVGGFVRKGVWLGLPAFELGAGAMSLIDSRLISWQTYAKLALHEGFHDMPVPSFAVRGSAAYVTGSDQIRMTVLGLDLIASKAFGVRGTFRFEPFIGTSFLFIHASSGVVDLSPSCDGEVVRTAGAATPVGAACANGQRGTPNDFRANYTFPDQDVITRQRYFVGAKFKFAIVFLTAAYELSPAGSSRDEAKSNGARDESGRQDTLSLSAGFDF